MESRMETLWWYQLSQVHLEKLVIKPERLYVRVSESFGLLLVAE